MPRPCTACHHPQRAAIDGLLAAGTPAGRVAIQFALSPDAVERHARNHLRRVLQTVRAALAPFPEVIVPLPAHGLLTVEAIAGRLAAVVGRAERLVEDAESSDNIVLRGAALKELRGALSDALRAATLLSPADPAPATMRADDAADAIADRLLEALAEHPEARHKAALALAAMARP